jgi:hypothetical protein
MLLHQHRLLLRAALLDGVDARAAWEQWRVVVDIEHLPPGQYLLLPLLSRNLECLGVEHPWLSRLKGVYRRFWYANQLALRRVADVLVALRRADIDALLVGEAVFALRDYPEVAARPISNLQIAVRPLALERVTQVLAKLGWRIQSTQPGPLPLRCRIWRSSCIFHAESGPALRLHWHVLADAPNTAADELLWGKACSLCVNDAVARTLPPTDRLMMACLSTDAIGPVALADAVLLLRHEPVDWEHLLSLARRLDLGVPLVKMLEALRSTLGIDLPPEVLAMLRSVSAARAYGTPLLFMPAGRPRALIQTWRIHYERFRRIARSQEQPMNPRTFLDYVQCAADVAHPWQLLPQIIARVCGGRSENR